MIRGTLAKHGGIHVSQLGPYEADSSKPPKPRRIGANRGCRSVRPVGVASRGVEQARKSTDNYSMAVASERRTLHAPTSADAARRILRAHLRPLVADTPQAWFGGMLTPGVRGFILGNHMLLVPVPPNRRLWSSRRSPTVRGRIVPRSDGGTDVRISVYTPGFPYRALKDSAATTFLDDWLSEVARELDAE
jgi:hypothetical protein